jgi:hypothetical protein
MKRWGIFQCVLNFSFHCWSTVVLVCMKPHTLCFDRNFDIPIYRVSEDVRDSDEWVLYKNYRGDDAELRG